MSRRRDATALSDGIWQDRDILFDLESRYEICTLVVHTSILACCD